MVFRIIFFLLAIFAFSTVFAADVTYGFLKGIVKTDVGVVCANEKVVITAGEQKLNYTTDATGSFTCMVPSGDATILVMGSTKSVKIIEGEALEVQFVITKPGIMLTINNVTENNDTTYYNYEFSYQKNGMDGYIQSQRLGLGKYFFTLPEDATVFQAKVSLRVNNNYVFPLGYVHKVWTFDTKELRHDFTMDYIKPTKISLKLFNSDNTAVADGTKISGKLSRNLPLNNFTDWSKVNLSDNNLYPSIYENNDYIRFNTVVKDGMAALPECMPAISYSIQFSVEGGMDGAAMPMVVDENGKADIDSYKFQLRKLIQTVFDSAGKPVANANVNASYTLKGQIKVVSAKSDDKGIVTWVGLPNCRVITWGDNIPVGLIAPVISELTTPFTKPPYHFPNDFIIRTTSKTGAISGYYQYAINDKTPPVYGNINTSGMTGYSSIQGNFNSLITMRVMTAEENPRYGELSFYVPYDDCPVPDPNGTEAIIEMTNFIPTTRHHIKILNADKTTPAQINSVKIYSDEALKSNNIYSSSMLKTRITSDGVDLWYINPGTYRVCVDMADDYNSPTAIINLPDKNDTIIVMPDITGTVPGGSIVSWIGADDPSESHIMRYLANNKDVPIYADKKTTLAWWCKTSPKNMRVWRNGKISDLSLRQFNIKQIDENGKQSTTKDLASNNQLSMLFPSFKTSDEITENTSGVNDNSEYSDINLPNKGVLKLWSAKYLLNEKSTVLSPSILNITKDTPQEIIVTKKSVKKEDNNVGKVRINIYKGSSQVYFRGNLSTIESKITFDGNEDNPLLFCNIVPYIKIPENAKTMTIVCPKYGMMKDMPIDIKDNTINIDADKFLPMAALTVKLCDAKGNQLKNATISVRRIDLADDDCTLYYGVFSNDGTFVFKGLLAGNYIVCGGENNNNANAYKAVTITNDDVNKVVDLALSDKPATIRVNPFTYSSSTTLTNNYAWYLPTGNNTAVPLPANQGIALPDTLDINTILYAMSTTNARNGTPVFTNVKWANKISYENEFKTNANISLITDLQDNFIYPSVILISGTGAWEGITYRQQLQWNNFGGIESAIAKISGPPPGKWKIKIMGDKIVEKEITMTNAAQAIRLELK